jgi:hypothetical protein
MRADGGANLDEMFTDAGAVDCLARTSPGGGWLP